MEPSNVPPECKTGDEKAQVTEASGEGAEKQEYCILPISQNTDRPEECDKLLQTKRVQSRHAPEFFCLMDSVIRNPENINMTEWERPSTADYCSQSLFYDIDGTLGEIFQAQNLCKNGDEESEQEGDVQQPELQETYVPTIVSQQDIDVQHDSCDISKEDMNILQPKLEESCVPDRKEDIHVQQPKLHDSCDISKEDMNILQPKLEESCDISKEDMNILQPKLEESCDISKEDMNILQPKLEESCVPDRKEDIHVQQPKLQVSYDVSKEDMNILQPKLEESCVPDRKEDIHVQQPKLHVLDRKEDMDVLQPKLLESYVAVTTQEEDVQQLNLHVNCVTDGKKDEDVVQQKLQENYVKKNEKKDSDQDEIGNEMFLRGPEGNHKFTSGTQSVLSEQQSSGSVGVSDPDRSTTHQNSDSEISLHSERQSTAPRNLPKTMLEAEAYIPVASFTAKNSLSMCDIIYGSDSDSGKSRESRESIFIPEYAHDVNIVSSGAGSLKTLISSESLGARNADSTGEHEVKAVGEKERPLVNSRSDEMWSAGAHPFWSSTDRVTGLETKLERWDRTTNLEMDEMCDHFMRCDCLLEAHATRKDVMACRTGTNELCETNSVFKSETGNKLKHLVNELIKPASNSELASDFKKADNLVIECEGDEYRKNIKFGNIVHHGMLKDKYMPRAYNEHSHNYFKCGDKKDFKMSSVYSSHLLKNVFSEEDMLGDLNQHKMQPVFFQRPKHRIRPGYCCRHGNPYTARQYNIHNEYNNPRLGGGTMCKSTTDSLEDQELWQVRNEDDCQLNIVIAMGCDKTETCDVASPEVKLTNKRPRDPSGESPEQKRSYVSNIGLITTKKPKASLYLGPEESEDEEDGDGDLMRAQQVMVEVILAGGESPVASTTDIRATIRDIIEPPTIIIEEKPFQQPESCSMARGPSCSLETHVVMEAGTLPKKKKKKNWFVNQFSRLMRYLFRKDGDVF